ncbi:hypothetical protein ACFQX7_30665 [Luedemannella flava]|uniref:hypothetical protein n=1 Tax=Luedemannella flava TaxID=349316 RepID=UPI0031DB01B4
MELDDDASGIERELAAAFPVGRWVDAGGREVRASVLARIAGSRPEPAWPMPGLRLRGARVVGQLNLGFTEVLFPLSLEDCDFAEAPGLWWADLGFTSLRRSRLPGLVAPNVAVRAHLRLDGCRFSGKVNLTGARLRGGLLLDGAELAEPGGVALDAQRIELGGDLRALDGFRATGRLQLFQATINGGVHLDGATIEGASSGVANEALDLDSATVRGGVFARNADIAGEISLRHATIGGVVTLTSSTVRNPGGVSLRMDRADVAGGVFLLNSRLVGEARMISTRIGRTIQLAGAVLDNAGGTALKATALNVDGSFEAGADSTGRAGLVANGVVNLVEASVTGPVLFEGARLDNPGGDSLSATGIRAGSVFNCCEGFTATGNVSVTSGRIASRLCFDRATLQSLSCSRADVNHLSMRFAVAPAGEVNLTHARVVLLQDDPATWPSALRLDGLTYQTLIPDLPPTERLGWLGREPRSVRPHPYQQLATAYRQLGHDEHARTVLLARQRRQTRSRSRAARAWGWLQDATVGYGYRPLRAVTWLLALLAIGSAVFAAHPPVAVNPGSSLRFNPVFYTLDLLLPIVGFGQEAAFEPAGAGQWLAYLLIAAGWTLATTAAAGFSRAITRT